MPVSSFLRFLPTSPASSTSGISSGAFCAGFGTVWNSFGILSEFFVGSFGILSELFGAFCAGIGTTLAGCAAIGSILRGCAVGTFGRTGSTASGCRSTGRNGCFSGSGCLIGESCSGRGDSRDGVNSGARCSGSDCRPGCSSERLRKGAAS